jgi:hypothetical protein
MQRTINKIVDFRLRQFKRVLDSIGIFYFLFALFLLSGVLLNFLANTFEGAKPWLGLLFFLLPLNLHFKRMDWAFLDKLNINKSLLFFYEYNLLSLPFYVLLLMSENWLALLILFTGNLSLIIIPVYKWKLNTQKWNLSFIPIKAFEIRCGLRNQFFGILFLYIICLGLSFFIGTLILFIFLFSLIVSSFYNDIEEKTLINSFTVSNFLWRKTLLHISIIQLALSPHYLLFLFFHLQYWFFVPALLLVSVMIQAFAIVYKYKAYYPGRRKVFNTTPVGVFSMAMLIPFFFPITFLMLFWYSHLAHKNMKLFL